MTSTQTRSKFGTFGLGGGTSNNDQSRTSSKAVGSGLGSTGASWDSGIWGNTIGSGLKNGSTDATRTQNDLLASSPNPEPISGSRSLLPSSESDHFGLGHGSWKSVDDTSPGLSTYTRSSTSPMRRQNSNQMMPQAFAESNAAKSQYLPPNPASANISSRSSQKNFMDHTLDPATGSFVSSGIFNSTNMHRSSRHNSDEENRYAAGKALSEHHDSGLNIPAGRPSFNQSISGYNHSAGSRSGSMPSSRSDVEQSLRFRNDAQAAQYSRFDPSAALNPVHRVNASMNAPSHTMQAAFSRQKYADQLSPGQMNDLVAHFDQMDMKSDYAQHSYGIQRDPIHARLPYTNGLPQNSASYPQKLYREEENGYQGHDGSFSPAGSASGSFGSVANRHRGLPYVASYSHSPSVSDAHLSHHSPFYPTAGTPPTFQQRTPSRGSYNSGPNAQVVEGKLLGLQQQQQGYVMPPPNSLQPRPHVQNEYHIHPQNTLRMHPLQQYQYINAPPHMLAMQSIPRGPADQHDMASAVRSALLEEFKSSGKANSRYELKDIYDHIVEFSGDQHGSRFIQSKLETANSDEKDQIFRELHPNARQLMTDVFGNYVIQKFFEHGNQSQKKMLANQMKNHVLTLSTQMYGCRVVQKALEHILTDQQAQLVKELENDVLKCVKDQNGNHVVQKAIERVPAEHIQFIINSFTGQVQALATHPYGCRVIQRMLEHCEEPTRTAVLQELHACGSSLIPDQYGNYVTQHVIEHGKPEDRSKIIMLVTHQLINFSRHKFASNVVEKSIEFGTKDERQRIVSILTVTNEKGESPVQLLIRDQFGNYVIQKLLIQLQGAEWEEFVELIKAQLTLLKRFSYGKQIASIEKVLYAGAFPQQIHNISHLPPTIDTSAVPTPPLLTGDGQSPQSSSQPSTHGGSVVATNDSRKSSGSNVVGVLTPTST